MPSMQQVHTAKFINLFRSHPCLWDRGVRKNKQSRDVAIDELIHFCRKTRPSADRKFVLQKIRSLRKTFTYEFRKIEESENKYRPKLWYYDLLTFLKPLSGEEYSIEIDEDDEDCDDEDNLRVDHRNESFTEEIEEGDFYSSLPPTLIIDKTDKSDDEAFESDDKTIQSVRIENFGEFDAVGINVAAKLKRMDAAQAVHAELLISQILGLGLQGLLSRQTELLT